MKIAITLLTCGRADYTARTVDTLLQHNPDLATRAVLLHGDDHGPAAQANKNFAIAREAGFATILSPEKQLGVARMTEELFRVAAERRVDAVLNLQNDWISERPIPWDDLDQLLSHPNIYNVRLYGEFKSWSGRCGIHHGGRSPREVVSWTPDSALPAYEVGDIHWGHPPAVTRIADAVALTKDAKSESESRRRSGDIRLLTARTIQNVMRHIGTERTPRFRA